MTTPPIKIILTRVSYYNAGGGISLYSVDPVALNTDTIIFHCRRPRG